MAGGWSNTTVLNTARTGCAAAGVQTAALAISGATTASAYINQTELFNGTAWSFGGNNNVARMDLGGCGLYNAALAFGGYIGSYTGVSETYNGTVWSMGVTMLAQRSRFAGFGTAAAAVAAGGYNGTNLGNADLFNGTTWTASGALIVSRSYIKGCGTTTAGLVAGGYVAAVSNVTESFNGTTWVYGGNLVTARQAANLFGTTTNSMSAGGSTAASSGFVTNCEKYNGSAWSSAAYTSNVVYRSGQAGTVSSAIRIGGDDATTRAYVEEYNEILQSYSWATGPCLIAEHQYSGGAGESVSDAIVFGGSNIADTAYYQTTEFFNGTLWATGGGLSRTKGHLTGSGARTTAICVGGQNGAYLTDLDVYNGTSWTAGGALITLRDHAAAAGNSALGLVAGGRTTGAEICTNSELYDGAAWSSVGTLNTARMYLAGCGIQTDAMCSGGMKAGSVISNITEKFDGSVWSNSGTLNVARQHPTVAGVSSDAKIAGGFNGSSYLTSTEQWTGATWTVNLNMNYSSAYANNGNMGTANSFIVAGGTQTASLIRAGMQVYTGGVPVIIDGAIFTSIGSEFIQQVWPPAMEGATSLYTFGKYIGPFFDLDYEAAQPSSLTEILAAQGIMAPFDFTAVPLGAVASILADLHVDVIMVATLPAMTGTGTLEVRSGRIIQNLPVFTMIANGQVGAVGTVRAYIPGIRITSTGLTGWIGRVARSLPFFTIISSGTPSDGAVGNLTLPLFYINAHGKVVETGFIALVMNPKNFAISEYEGFSFNSFALFNGQYLAAGSGGIYVIGGASKDGISNIDTELKTGQLAMGSSKPRDIYLAGKSDGQMLVTLSENEDTPNNAKMNYLLETLGLDRAKVPRGMKPDYLQVGIKNVSGADFDLDSMEIYAEGLTRKKK